MKKAYFVKDVSDKFTNKAYLYRLDPPMKDSNGDETEYVVTSAARVPFSGPETYIFASDSGGNVSCWGELDGSFQGALDCDKALQDAGYQVITEED